VDGEKGSYVELMEEVFTFITPGWGGVNRAALFTDGIVRYGAKAGRQVIPLVLEIPAWPRKRPQIDVVKDFITASIRENAPVAFLNLTNGTLRTIENWHWVTVIAFDPDTMRAEISDYGETVNADVSVWLKTSILGGAFVRLRS